MAYIKIEICKHCCKRKRKGSGTLCGICEQYPRCRGCERIMGEQLTKQSKNKRLCTDCYETKTRA